MLLGILCISCGRSMAAAWQWNQQPLLEAQVAAGCFRPLTFTSAPHHNLFFDPPVLVSSTRPLGSCRVKPEAAALDEFSSVVTGDHIRQQHSLTAHVLADTLPCVCLCVLLV